MDPSHYRKLTGSGLILDTIKRSRAYTERSTGRLRVLLNGIQAVAPALILPFFGRDGKRPGYSVARMFRGPVKYWMPKGVGNQGYFPPFPCVREAVNNPGRMVVITEGVLKALASCQAGVPCIGLMGMWNWSVKRKDDSEPRQLIPDLDGIDWEGRVVLIIPDSDPLRNPSVHHGAVELARLLTERGADVRLPRLPLGPRDEHGRPVKQAVDDYIVRYGEEAWVAWVQEQLAEKPMRDLEDYRAEMLKVRIDNRTKIRATLQDVIDYPAMCETLLDYGPTGVGKSYHDIAAINEVQEQSMRKPVTLYEAVHIRPFTPRSTTYVPTHRDCEQVVREAAKQGLEVVAYPKLTQETCERYEEATAVMGRGLAFQFVLCPDCPYREDCQYRLQREAADNAPHAVATQARSIHTLGQERRKANLIILHEAPLEVIRPTVIVTQGLLVVELIARQAGNNAKDARDRGFYRHMGRVAKELDGWLNSADHPDVVPLPEAPAHVPAKAHKDLNDAILALGIGIGKTPTAQAMQLVLAGATGGLKLVGVSVDQRPAKGNAVNIIRKLEGVVNLDLPPGCWLNDATADRTEIEEALGRPVKDITPSGRLFRHHPVLQIIPRYDVTKARKASEVLSLLRGLLHDLPHSRIGLLTHKRLAKELPLLLESPYRERLVMVEYFGGGMSRGSNEWIGRCDALIVLGTPRVGADAIRLHLFRLEKIKAAGRTREEAGWEWDYWSGVTESGQRRTVKCKHYADHDWHAAYCSLVRSELRQAIGRGRGILPDGIPVYVVTNEDLSGCGYRLAEEGRFAPLTEAQVRVLDCLWRDGLRAAVKSADVARILGVSSRLVRKLLAELESARRVGRVGEKGGWFYVPPRG